MKTSNPIRSALTALVVLGTLACTSSAVGPADDDTSDAGPITASGIDLNLLTSQFASSIEISNDGDVIVFRSDGVPDHPSPYFAPTDARYEAYNGSNSSFHLNPNRIAERTATYRIPRFPVEAANKSATPLGAIGIAVNGVAIFNQYAGPNQPLTFEIDSFDQYNGHPQQTGVYHYHIQPLGITGEVGVDALIGVLLDGFPLYGPYEGGAVVTNADLDAYHGHSAATPDFPDGVYHYHVTSEDPYINGAGFFGIAGSVGG
jgi:hypothetical protein